MLSKNRNFGLDVIRTVAILMVLLHHWVAYNLSNYEPTRAISQYFSLFGYYGVEIFFVLSGFLIGNILIKIYINKEGFPLSEVTNFWMRRWFRTLPLYYFILFLHIAIELVKGRDLNFIWKYFLFLQNFFSYNTSNNDFFGESWSLALEEWFYLTFPLFLVFFNQILRKRFTKQRILLVTILSYIAIPTAVRFGITIYQDPSWNNVLRKAIICREDSIAYGVMGAYLFNFFPKIYSKPNFRVFLIGVISLFLGAYIFSIEISNDYYYKTGDVSFFSKTALFSLVSIGVLLTLPYMYNLDSNLTRLKGGVTYISRISYSLYLTHLFVEHAAQKILPGNSLLMILGRLFIFVLGSCLVSMLTFKFIEEKFLVIRDRFWKEKVQKS